MVDHHRPERVAGLQPAWNPCPGRQPNRLALGRQGAILALDPQGITPPQSPPAVAPDLAGDGRARPHQPARDRRRTQPQGQLRLQQNTVS